MADKYGSRYTILLVIREMEMKITMRCHLTPTRMTKIKRQMMASVDKDVEKLESSHIVARNTKWRNHSGKESRSAPKSYTRVTI